MNDLRDTRKLVGRTVTDELGIKGRYAMAAQEAVYELLAGNPDVELATIRFRVDADHPPKVTVTGRVGSLVGPDDQPATLEHVMTCCNQLEGRPHTDYCRGMPVCSAPRDALPGGRPCSDDRCPVHAEREPDCPACLAADVGVMTSERHTCGLP